LHLNGKYCFLSCPYEKEVSPACSILIIRQLKVFSKDLFNTNAMKHKNSFHNKNSHATSSYPDKQPYEHDLGFLFLVVFGCYTNFT